jgi:acyl-coenzyme A synthetase/AMP-(fatty) acid ligase
MIPNKVIIIDDLPKNANGKVDRIKLDKLIP